MPRTPEPPVASPVAPPVAAEPASTLFEPAPHERVAVRMYCQGFGDCFLIAIRHAGGVARILIDCGVVRNTPDERERMRAVVGDVQAATGGHLDVVVVTHEHYDHVCGFAHARDLWETFRIGELWLAWTEDPTDSLAQRIAKYRQDAFGLLLTGAPVNHMSSELGSLLGLLPAYANSTGDALQAIVDIAIGQSATVRYVRPGSVLTIPGLPNETAQAIALGPPRDEKKIRDLDGVFGDTFASFARLAADADVSAADTYAERLRHALGLGTAAVRPVSPFSESYALAANAAPGTPAAARWNLYGPRPATGSVPRIDDLYEDPDLGWRRIDAEHLARFDTLAMQLDALTNNISLALAFRVGTDVLLFPGDAQIGNWKSWSDATYTIGGRPWTAAELMAAVRIYKVGHHASHNGTCRPDRLDLMPSGTISLIPLEAVGRWPSIPALGLISALQAKGPSARSDQSDQAVAPFRPSLEVVPGTTRPLYLDVGV